MNRATIGLVEWFTPGEHERVERVLADMRALGISRLRTGVSWANWHTERGQEWYEWLLPRLAEEVEVLPCLAYTPPSLAVAPRHNAPPRQANGYAAFVDLMITRFGHLFDHVELWNEPNNRSEWDWTLDPEWKIFTKMIGDAAHWAKKRGKTTVLGGMSPIDPHWLGMMFDRGLMEHIDAVGIHGFPGTWEVGWDSWEEQIARVQKVLDEHDSRARIWISEVGFSTWPYQEVGQLRTLLDVMDQRVERIYWHAAQDSPIEVGRPMHAPYDPRDHHFGLRRVEGKPKLLHHLWKTSGAESLRDAAWLTVPLEFDRPERPVVITGGAGFIGINLAHRLLSEGRRVLILDNLGRDGTYRNLQWLRSVHGARARVRVVDIRDAAAVRLAVQNASAVFHLAAQVAVTTSLETPRDDFEVNAQGTLNVLEALREMDEPVPLVFTSTNKVYGAMPDVKLEQASQRVVPSDEKLRASGIDELRPLDFHSPYGCSKGAADQYVLDYARVFDLPSVVFRMSCIYGPHQHGNEDQGWVAHFLLQAMRGQPITVYGDGKQVRDVMFVDDLVDAVLIAEKNARKLSGRAFNIGGGTGSTLSLLELLDRIPALQEGARPEVRFTQWRPGDQPYYVSDTRAFERATGWKRRVSVDDGLQRLQSWLNETRGAPATPSPSVAISGASAAMRGV